MFLKNKVFRKAIDAAVKGVLKYVEQDDFDGTQKKLFDVLDQAKALTGNSGDAAVFEAIRNFISDKDSKWMKYLYGTLRKTSPNVIKTEIINIAYQSVAVGMGEVKKSIEKYGCAVPWFVVIEPTSINNIKESGSAEVKTKLSYSELNNIINQCKQLGLYFFIIYGSVGGGEPLTMKDDLFKLARKHSECAFHTVTNGTLVDDDFAREAAQRGNITFSFEYLGSRSRCDSLYGEGTGKRADSGIIHMRRRGVLFGSIAECSNENIDYLISDAFYDMMISKACRFVIVMDNMRDTAEKSTASRDLHSKIEQIRGDKGGKPIFAVDFFNDVEYIGKRITAPMNYIHIDSSGDVAADSFSHGTGSIGNIKEKKIIQMLKK